MKSGFSLVGICLNLLGILVERGYNLSGGWVEIGWNLIKIVFWYVVGFFGWNSAGIHFLVAQVWLLAVILVELT